MIYDIIVIGAGSGGLNIAGFMNKAGFRTLLIDKSDENIGGDCLNTGCVPSKALIHVSKLIHDANAAENFGLNVGGKVNLKKVVQYIKEKQDIIRVHENAAYFKKIGMDVVLGNARFVSENSVNVAGKTYTGKKIVIATGSRPRKLNVPGIEQVKYHTNETIFGLEELPKDFLIIGGGPIGIEIGQAFSRLGSKVTIVQNTHTFLLKESPEMAEILLHCLAGEGMQFHFNSRPIRFTSKNEVVIEDKNKKKTELKFDAMLVSIGRNLNIEELDLENREHQG